MDKSTIQTLIDKVIGKKGLIRVPSWWMRKVLMQIADWVQEGDDANGEKIVKIDEDIIKLRNLTLPYMLVSGTGEVNIDGNKVSLTDADKQLIYITGAVKFKKGDDSYNDFITYIYIPHIDIRSQGRDMSYMFAYCTGLTSLDLSGFDTSAVTSMTYMFDHCTGLTSLDLSSFDISAVTSMAYMFAFCESLTSLDLSGFDTSAVTSMDFMFCSCTGLTSLDLSGFDTSAVTSMTYMFDHCTGLTSLDLSSFDTSAVTDMDHMFAHCESLTSLDLSSFDTSAVTDMAYMFDHCYGLTSLDLSGFNTSAVTDMAYMFDSCHSLTSLDLSGFNTSAVTDMVWMFYGCSVLTSIDLSSFDTTVAMISQMFYNCLAITSLILGPNFFKTSETQNFDLSDCTKWTNDTVVTSLVTNSYDRATAGLKTMTLKLSANTKAALTDEHKAAITAKGYTIA